MKEQKGITLIALIVTIIVLLILAGVTISTITGENGIVGKANDSKERTGKADIIEETRLEISDKQIESKGKLYKSDFVEILESKGTLSDEEDVLDKTLTTEEGYKIPVKDIYDGPFYEIPTITFKIYNTEYIAEEGMTWEEWLFSQYNEEEVMTYEEWVDSGYINECIRYDGSDGWIINGWGGFLSKDGVYGMERYDYAVFGNEEIISEYTYYWQPIAECVYPDSEIMIDTEGNYTLAKDIEENDEIVYFDFEENSIKVGKVSKVYIHEKATKFVKYTFEDGSYLEATDYHPIYTKEGWKSATQRKGYEIPEVGDEVKTATGWKEIINIEMYEGIEDCYDFEVLTETGKKVTNYFANNTLVEGSY